MGDGKYLSRMDKLKYPKIKCVALVIPQEPRRLAAGLR